MSKKGRGAFVCHLVQILTSIAALIAFVATAFAASNETVLYSFPGGVNGANPYGALIANSTGALYGTTAGGGSSTNCNMGSGCGTVFVLSPPSWTPTVLYSFRGASVGDGSAPQGALLFDTKGALYGTTAGGGAYGFGAVFKLTPPATQGGTWTESVLYSFTGGTDGANPASELIFDGTKLVGTTPLGGASNFGTVFQLTPPTKKTNPWTEALLYNFTGRSDGGKPYGGVVLKAKALYGTTLDGGSGSQGTVFELTPPAVVGAAWAENVVYSFTGGTDGGKPYARVIFGRSGALYGTTGLGGSGYGTVFELKLGTNGVPSSESVLFTFGGGPDGAYPRYGVVTDKKWNLYGTTGVGPANSGVVFELVAPAKITGVWTEKVLWTFSGAADGGATTAGLALFNSVLYGTTSLGGQYGKGVVFSVTP
jgi:uncharacterized repeat protein (TIGR03803 family)